MFVHSEWDKHSGQGTWIEQNGRVVAAYHALTDLEKSTWIGNAEADTRKRKEIGTIETHCASLGERRDTKHRRKESVLNERRLIVADTAESLQTHSIFKAGFQLGCYSSAIKPELIPKHSDAVLEGLIICRSTFGGLTSPMPRTSRPSIASEGVHFILKK